MNRQYVMCLCLCAQLAVLAACDTRGSGNDNLQGGIEGSGHRVTTSGTVTALGSIVVNEVEYDLTGATITINGSPAAAGDLAPGHVAVIEGEIGADGTRGTATRVALEVAVAGPISAIDDELGQLVVLGQTIAIDGSSIIEDRADDRPLGGLVLGRDVQVSGFVDSSGVLYARRVEARKPSMPLTVSGQAVNIDTAAHAFSVNGQVVSYAGATLRGFASVAAGDFVRVSAKSLDQDVLVADEVMLRAASLPGAAGDTAVVQGWVTRFASERDFEVDGYPVVTAANTVVDRESVVRLDAFVAVSGELNMNGIVIASDTRAVLPGRLVGNITVGDEDYGISGLFTSQGAFRLTIGQLTSGPPESESAFAQMIGSFAVTGRQASGSGVLIGEACALPSAGRFCGTRAPVRIELTKTGAWIDEGASGLVRVTTSGGEQVWPLHIGYWGGRAGFDPSLLSLLEMLYHVHQAEFSLNVGTPMTIDGEGRLFFQSAETGCTGNGALSPDHAGALNLYRVALKIESCNGAFGYLNADFEGLSTLESLTPWDYDYSVLRIWVSTPADAPSPAAISFWSAGDGQ